jgi:hypothetical protein
MMIAKELADQLRAEVKSLKEVQERFLQTYKQLCAHCGGSDWRKEETEILCHHVRKSIIPILEQEGMDRKSVQALCSWAERVVLSS